MSADVPEAAFLLFGEYNYTEVEVTDPGLIRYINLEPVGIPHSGARNANIRFGKSRMNVVERLINNMMRTETFTGKKTKTYSVVRKAFAEIKKKTKTNPIQVLVKALENSAPREEITRLKYGGISVPKAVDVSPARRLDIGLRNICRGATKASHKNRRSIESCLAAEIMAGAKRDMNSFAVSKKEELERIASSAR